MPYFEQAGVAHKIDIRIDDAVKSLDALDKEKASFDMVGMHAELQMKSNLTDLLQIFIDAHKPSYTNYFNRIMSSPYLLSKGGLIVADNVAFKAAPWARHPTYGMAEDIHKFNEAVR